MCGCLLPTFYTFLKLYCHATRSTVLCWGKVLIVAFHVLFPILMKTFLTFDHNVLYYICYSFFLNCVLRYNLHIVQVTYFNCINQCYLVSLLICATNHLSLILKCFDHPTKIPHAHFQSFTEHYSAMRKR